MQHLGDITKISGYTAPPVNVMIGGSPCQDLSVAGKRAGLQGERSGLFMEQIRIIKEMRENDIRNGRTDNNVRPRFMVWENVLGAFSSNKGEDFWAVLEETAKIADKNTVIPRPPKGNWANSGCIMGDGWSIAWRVFDAQFWGVPQRRRRIALVADFGGESAPEILFERKSVSGNSLQSGTAWQRAGGTVERSVDTASKGIITHAYSFDSVASNSMKSKNPHSGCREVDKAKTLDTSIPDPSKNQGGIAIVQSIVRPAMAFGFKCNMGVKAHGVGFEKEKAPTLQAGQHDASVVVGFSQAAYDKFLKDNKSATLKSNGGSYGGESETLIVFHGQASTTAEISASKNVSPTLMNTKQVDVLIDSIVRRLTPLECERLQGFPDYWTVLPLIDDMSETEYIFWKTVLFESAVRNQKARQNEEGIFEVWREIEIKNEDGKTEKIWVNTHNPYKHKSKSQMVKWYNKSFVYDSDSRRYKALGNSIALPNWFWLLDRLNRYCGNDNTMASLFDGIGGFPLIWETLNGKGSCLWASEIEEFAIAVTKFHFGDDENAT